MGIFKWTGELMNFVERQFKLLVQNSLRLVSETNYKLSSELESFVKLDFLNSNYSY